ncbi:transglycosylase SLT domain-containing protein [Thauera linaloolentis]|uniref:Lytic transglycosylase n=1 Tax=Thauera linaloolentis (strain DSM 12138 / JCM 21573 / CCUG 41526 / CIP 105981 / IAM 15112 / NBRC 102519 / 47Lol) TaxID=1123367 RepID=N6XZH4_THAL4|nr:transglycosylase SLT domain-containing protein [Thauera linaloolentis]ENO84665.1 lytic transglycosylase [Thauera linaloolentis 47Lol = DSM 12138]MCM8566559.1 transglycosylase SLT domain-containing protein [Thauera linaloolentis]
MPRHFAALLAGAACLWAFAVAGPAHAQEPAPAAAPLEVDEVVIPERVLTLDLTRDANDIWDRIRRGFGIADLDSERVGDQQAFYLNRPGFLKQVFSRGGRYLYYIVDELERRGMPTELALLPMVESSYNPLAYSRAHASGLWQFIPSTGKHYNLTQDAWIDERRDVIASTNAALDYLQYIYEMHGDWHLALASYNWGEGSVQRALKRNADEGLPLEYSHLRMPDETRNYVPKLQAIKNIVSEPELFHFELPYVANEMHFVSVDAPVGVDLATAATLSGMPLEEFLALNPGFNRPVTTMPGQAFIVPTDRARQLREGLDELQRSGKGWSLHTVERGERLDQIAARHDLTVSELRQVNGLSGNTVSAGHTLLVPIGIDPDGALQVSGMLPFAAAAARQQGLRIGGSGGGLKASAAVRATSGSKKAAAPAKPGAKKAAPKAAPKKTSKPAAKKAPQTSKAKSVGKTTAKPAAPKQASKPAAKAKAQ